MASLSDPISQARIEKGVLDLLFRQFKTGHWAILPLAAFILYLLRENIQPVDMSAWAILFLGYLLISDLFILRPYNRRWGSLSDNHKWFLLLALHNFIFSGFLASLPVLCVLNVDQFGVDLVTIMVCTLILGGCAALAAHLTSCIAWSVPQLTGLFIFIGYQSNPELHTLTLYSVVTFIIGILFALNLRRFVYSSVETSLKNEDLVEQLKTKQQIADQAARDKSRFLASASHDLRQPLHALGLFLETLDEHTTNETQKDLINNIHKAFAALQELFNALLDISRLDADTVEIKEEHFLINNVLKQIGAEFKTIAEKKGIQLEMQETDAVIYSDRILTDRILRNLISNAVKYTNKGFVRIKTTRTADKVCIEVIDTGVGIPETESENIFSEFYQINNPERDRSKGLGLGLSIVRRLVNLLNLKLTLQSYENEGSIFAVTFPAGRIDKVRQAPVQAETILNNFDGMHVLVIDDEKHILEGMNVILGKWGFKVSLRESLESALDVIHNGETPDIILSDLRLRNNTTGIEAIEQIRKLAGRNIPALLLSGDTDPQKIKAAQAAGIILLYKPVKPALLKAAINNVLSINI